ncbi:hypothetical protein [Bacteroides cutis]|uniref:hypothetical protein n=1 Tax=Bacteroides cutis TaxID=2024197 RepID=UPI003F94FD80
MEVDYEKGKLSSEQIKAFRDNLKTKEIIIKIRSKLDAMLSDVHPARGDLMEKALNYLNTFWPPFLLTPETVLIRLTILLPNVSYVPWLASARTPYSLAAVRWPEYRWSTIPSSPLARCREFLPCNTLRCFSGR